MSNTMFGHLTASTCGEACWYAHEEVCRCSCGGANHGILRNSDSARPNRTRRIDGVFYELVAIVSMSQNECFSQAYHRVRKAEQDTLDERFPNIDPWAYGNYRLEKNMPVLSRKVSSSQANWAESLAVTGTPFYMVWSLPKGSKYLKRGIDYKPYYATHMEQTSDV